MILQSIKCESCGASDWESKGNTKICKYCGSIYVLSAEKAETSQRGIPFFFDKSRDSEIALNDDVERLLKKCRADPKNAKKYANLILDIDPTNREALKYIK